MIIFNSSQKDNLQEFGIEIPISSSKTRKSMEFLSNHPILKNSINDWLLTEIKDVISKEDLLRVHSKQYIDRLYSSKLNEEIIKTYELIDKNGNYYRYNPANAVLPFSHLLKNVLNKAAGTVYCMRIALSSNFCFYFGGGMHHAKYDYGEGFCVVNDLIIAIRKLQNEKLVKQVWIIDVDAHKGDGTSFLTSSDPSIITLSIHMAGGWPLDSEMYINGKLNPSFVPSNIDIPVEEFDNKDYVKKLEKGLIELKKYKRPDIALVVLGSDPYEQDELPSAQTLRLSLSQMMERDMLIYNFLKDLGIPQSYVMAGGYGENSWKVYSQFLEYVLLDRLSQKS
jgi:acetoin utilization deacetylase AcuC-like enzyme